MASDGVIVAPGRQLPFVPEVGRDVGEDDSRPVGARTRTRR